MMGRSLTLVCSVIVLHWQVTTDSWCLFSTITRARSSEPMRVLFKAGLCSLEGEILNTLLWIYRDRTT